jgi:type IV pilus assembly protein PilX
VTTPARRARGAALPVALILLLIFTLFGVSTLGNATLDLRVAANAQNQSQAFQAAERGVDVAMATTVPDTTQAVTNFTPIVTPEGDRIDYEMRFDEDNGVTDVPTGGFSLGAGVGFQAMHFELAATATSTRGATAAVTQGYYVVSPPTN